MTEERIIRKKEGEEQNEQGETKMETLNPPTPLGVTRRVGTLCPLLLSSPLDLPQPSAGSRPLLPERLGAPPTPCVMSVRVPLGCSFEAPWGPFGAFGIHFLSLVGVFFFGNPLLLGFWTPQWSLNL